MLGLTFDELLAIEEALEVIKSLLSVLGIRINHLGDLGLEVLVLLDVTLSRGINLSLNLENCLVEFLLEIFEMLLGEVSHGIDLAFPVSLCIFRFLFLDHDHE